MPKTTPTLIYTETDEAPLLATYSLLPIVRAFAAGAGVKVETRDISLAGRIIAQFPERLTAAQRVPDALGELGAHTTDPQANIVKLPNISASVPQLLAAIAELHQQGYDVPGYPATPATPEQQEVRRRYDTVLGSAVNPVLRQGNSDRRAPASAKAYARSHPHRMGVWSPGSRTAIATMATGDFYANEKSLVFGEPDELTIRFVPATGGSGIGEPGYGEPGTGRPDPVRLRTGIRVGKGDVVDASYLAAAQLDEFLAAQVARAKAEGLLFSIHLKATMMKVSDPIIFGHAVRAYFASLFAKYGAELQAAGINANDGLGSLRREAQHLPNSADVLAEVDADLANGPALAMVDSDQGITCLHVPSDVIIDASMPAMIRAGGKMWGPDGKEHDCLAVIPDSSYAGVYQAVIADCKANGALDPATIGSVSNVGLMAGAAEEYGSHDKTFEMPGAGRVEVVNSAGEVLLAHEVATGDIWRACHTQHAAISDWVQLAIRRGQATGAPIVFWLDAERPHDAALLTKLETLLPQLPTDGLDILVMAPADACAFSLSRMRAGLDTIAVTGNVLRDYLTDLFPILELGTSAKMLSVVPLMAGGGLFETGAGGSAPKHVQQLLGENYLRWDSLGEFFALAAAFEHLARTSGDARIQVFAETMDRATAKLLEENKSPTRRVGGLDNRGSHYWLARFWAQELAQQTSDSELAAQFAPVAHDLVANEAQIEAELLAVQGNPVDIGGYYRPDRSLASDVMRPSPTLNAIIDELA